MAIENKRMAQLRDTVANWTSNNPILLNGEFGIESDTGRLKVGDGISRWNVLPYAVTDGQNGPRGEPGPPGFGGVVADYTELRALSKPLNGELQYVTTAGLEGTFVFDENELRSDNGGIIIAPDDATTGKWVRLYNTRIRASWFEGLDPTGVSDSSTAIQNMLEWASSSGGTGEFTKEIIEFGPGDFLVNLSIRADKGNFQIIGAGRRTTRFFSTTMPNGNDWIFEFGRSDGSQSGGIRMEELRIDGDNQVRGIRLENVNYSGFRNVEIRECQGFGLKCGDAQDLYFDTLLVMKCGNYAQMAFTDVDMTASSNVASFSDVISVKEGQMVTIAGAGPGGDDLEAVVLDITGTNVTLSETCSTTVVDAVVYGGEPAVMLGEHTEDDPTTSICTSFSFYGGCIISESNYHGMMVYKGSNIRLNGVKFHGIDEATNPSAPKHDLLVADRTEGLNVQGCLLNQVRHRAIRVLQSGGTLTPTFTIDGNVMENPSDLAGGDDIGFIEIDRGTGVVDNNVFGDTLSHASFDNNGFIIKLGSAHKGVTGSNNIFKVDDVGGGPYAIPPDFMINGNPLMSQPNVARLESNLLASRGGTVHRTFTPTLVGATTAGSPTYVLQQGQAHRTGDHCFFAISLEVSALGGAAGNLRLEGLPWSASNTLTTVNYPCAVARVDDYTKITNGVGLIGLVSSGTDFVVLRENIDGGNSAQVQISDIGSTFKIDVSGWYYANA